LRRAYFQTERGRVRVLHEPAGLPNVRVLTVVGPLPFGGRNALVHRVNARAVELQVRAALAAFPLENPLFLAQHPKAHALAKRLGLGDVVYDCLDDFAAFEGWHDPRMIERYEEELFRSAKLVTASARGLVARAKAAGVDAELVPNGVELQWFRADTEAKRIEKPAGAKVFGFIGAIYEWIDLGLVEALAKLRPDDLVVLVGPLKAGVAAELERVKALPNVRFVGPVPHREVASWIAAFDACLLPFKRNRLTESVNPLKLHEYFALGKPCLATGIPEIARWGELVSLADTADALPAAVARIEGEWRDPELSVFRTAARRKVALEHSWDAITARLAGLLERV